MLEAMSCAHRLQERQCCSKVSAESGSISICPRPCCKKASVESGLPESVHAISCACTGCKRGQVCESGCRKRKRFSCASQAAEGQLRIGLPESVKRFMFHSPAGKRGKCAKAAREGRVCKVSAESWSECMGITAAKRARVAKWLPKAGIDFMCITAQERAIGAKVAAESGKRFHVHAQAAREGKCAIVAAESGSDFIMCMPVAREGKCANVAANGEAIMCMHRLQERAMWAQVAAEAGAIYHVHAQAAEMHCQALKWLAESGKRFHVHAQACTRAIDANVLPKAVSDFMCMHSSKKASVRSGCRKLKRFSCHARCKRGKFCESGCRHRTAIQRGHGRNVASEKAGAISFACTAAREGNCANVACRKRNAIFMFMHRLQERSIAESGCEAGSHLGACTRLKGVSVRKLQYRAMCEKFCRKLEAIIMCSSGGKRGKCAKSGSESGKLFQCAFTGLQRGQVCESGSESCKRFHVHAQCKKGSVRKWLCPKAVSDFICMHQAAREGNCAPWRTQAEAFNLHAQRREGKCAKLRAEIGNRFHGMHRSAREWRNCAKVARKAGSDFIIVHARLQERGSVLKVAAERAAREGKCSKVAAEPESDFMCMHSCKRGHVCESVAESWKRFMCMPGARRGQLFESCSERLQERASVRKLGASKTKAGSDFMAAQASKRGQVASVRGGKVCEVAAERAGSVSFVCTGLQERASVRKWPANSGSHSHVHTQLCCKRGQVFESGCRKSGSDFMCMYMRQEEGKCAESGCLTSREGFSLHAQAAKIRATCATVLAESVGTFHVHAHAKRGQVCETWRRKPGIGFIVHAQAASEGTCANVAAERREAISLCMPRLARDEGKAAREGHVCESGCRKAGSDFHGMHRLQERGKSCESGCRNERGKRFHAACKLAERASVRTLACRKEGKRFMACTGCKERASVRKWLAERGEPVGKEGSDFMCMPQLQDEGKLCGKWLAERGKRLHVPATGLQERQDVRKVAAEAGGSDFMLHAQAAKRGQRGAKAAERARCKCGCRKTGGGKRFIACTG
eukprot:gene31558-6744_t